MRGQPNWRTQEKARSFKTKSGEIDLDTTEQGKDDLINTPIIAGEQDSSKGRKEVHPEGGTTCPQNINPSEQREGVSVSLTAAGAGPPAKLFTKQLRPSEASYRPMEDTSCQQYISNLNKERGSVVVCQLQRKNLIPSCP